MRGPAAGPAGVASGTVREPRPSLPRGFGSLWLTVVLDLVGFGIILPVLPLYVEDLGASPAIIGVVLAAYSVAQLVGAPVLGRLSDHHGRRPVLVLALIGSAVGHLVTGLAGSVWVVLAARAFDGLSGGSLSIAHAAVTDLAPPPERPRLFGLLGAGIAIGFVAGPALGSLAALGGAHVPFFVAAALCGANAVSARWRLPALPARRGGPSVGPGLIRGLGTALHPGTALGRTLLASLAVGVAFAGFESTFSLLGRERVGLTEGSAGLVFAGVGVVLAVVQGVVVRRLIERRGAQRTAVVAAVVDVAGFALLVPALGWWGFIPAIALLSAGQGLFSPAVATLVADVAPEERRGATFGVQQSVSAASRVLGPLLGLALFGARVPLPYVVGMGLALAGLAALLTLRDEVADRSGEERVAAVR